MEQKRDYHYLSLIIPSYNRGKTIVSNLLGIKRVLDKIRYDHEIIVVVDGKIDDTVARIKKAKISKVKLHSYQKNQGKAYAIRYGMNHARGDYLMFIDSGLEIDPNGISMLLEHMEWYNADIIVGSKRHPASQVKYSITRKVLSYGYFYLVKFLFGVTVKDTQAGIKVFKRRVLKAILPRLIEKKFAGDLEMLVVAKQLGFNRIYEAPIKLNYDFAAITDAATINSIVRIFIDTMAIFYRTYILRYYRSTHKH